MSDQAFDEYRDNYDDVVQDSIDFSGLEHGFFMRAKLRMMQRIAAFEFPGKPMRELDYLDVGCGVGAFHAYVADQFDQIHGCDPSTESIARARIQNPDVKYEAYDGFTLPYEGDSFDLLTTICVVHHVPVDQWASFFSEMRRVLRPGGVACVIEHNPLNPATRLAVARCPFDHDAVLLTKWKAQRLAKEAGFANASTRNFLFMPFDKSWVPAVEAKLEWLPAGAQYVTVARV